MSNGTTTVRLQKCLHSLGENDPDARGELLGFAHRRLKLLAERMFLRFPQLYAREQADDLFQETMVRLWKSLGEVYPTTVGGFMGLAAMHMRRALADLARSHFGRDDATNDTRAFMRPVIQGGGGAVEDHSDDARNAPEELASWSEFHLVAGQLPEPHRTAFDLLFYHELPQAEVASQMSVSIRQVQRYWSEARLKLCQMLDGAFPEL